MIVALAIVQPLQDFRDPGFQQVLVGVVEWIVFAVVRQQFTEIILLPLADRLVERQRRAAHPHGEAGLVHRQSRSLGRFLDARLGTAGLKEACGSGLDLGQPVAHERREANDPTLVGDCSANPLANPPGGVSGKLVPAGVVEPIDCSHQAGVALLDQVEEAHAAIAVAFGDGNGQSQVGGRQIRPCGFVFLLRRAMRRSRRRSEEGVSKAVCINWKSSC